MHGQDTTAQGLELYSENLGPAAGPHRLGVIDAPGLYFLVADNAAGKSHEYRMLGLLNDEKALAKEISISRGQVTAEVRLGARRVTFRRSPTGLTQLGKAEGEAPQWEEMPDPIDALITGGHMTGEDARLRHRLKALLAFAPVEVDDDRFSRLMECCEGRFPMPSGERASAWSRLAADLAGRDLAAAYASLNVIWSMVSEEAEDGDDVLAVHGKLLKLLNSLGLTAEKLHAAQQRTVDAADATLEQIVAGSGASQAQLSDAGDRETCREALSAAREKAAEIRADRRRLEAELKRRDELRAAHGERPSAENAEAAVATLAQEREDLTEQLEEAQKLLAEANAAAAVADHTLASIVAQVGRSVTPIRNALDRLRAITTDGGMRLLDLPDVAQAMNEAATSFAVASVESAPSVEKALKAGEEIASRQRNADRVRSAVDEIEKRFTAALNAMENARDRVAEWDRVERLLSEELAGPTESMVAKADQAVEAAEIALRVAKTADDYRAAAARSTEARDLLEWFAEMGAEYRKAAADSWAALGQVVTEALALPWLRVDGMHLVLIYGPDGELRLDPSAEGEERILDDGKMVSRGELREACLRLMVERSPAGSHRLIPDLVTFALDHEARRRLSGWLHEAGITAVSERPRTEHDPEGLLLEYVEPLDGFTWQEQRELAEVVS